MNKKPLTFAISLSVLNHLGRNLYRSFITVIGEAISNAWDADARNVYIYIDAKNDSLVIKDDGVGMDEDDFQNKFLKIGYSKRKDGSEKSPNNRPFIGRKGIGKLALLSCAEKVTIITRKTEADEYTGGTIANSGLDKAILDDVIPSDYPLEDWKGGPIEKFSTGHTHGTIIHFEMIKDGIKKSIENIQKQIALYFRFSLIDSSFNIYLNDQKISVADLQDLVNKTEYLWKIGTYDDALIPLIEKKQSEHQHIPAGRVTAFDPGIAIHGFIASVEKPRHLKVLTAEERVSIDLFVNGRLRERDLLKHIPTARVVESYLYGQIHFNDLDDVTDRFTSSREGVVADDPKFKELLTAFQPILKIIIDSWDKWRIEDGEDGDPDNNRMTKKERKSVELYGAVAKDYDLPKSSANKHKIDAWLAALAVDAKYNFESYAECFISENLIRMLIAEKKIALSPEAIKEAEVWMKRETEAKGRGNISIDVRRENDHTRYLSMNDLACLVDKKDPQKEACLARDGNEYKPMRDAVAHTSLLTDEAKAKLTSVYNNIKGRIKTLLGS